MLGTLKMLSFFSFVVLFWHSIQVSADNSKRMYQYVQRIVRWIQLCSCVYFILEMMAFLCIFTRKFEKKILCKIMWWKSNWWKQVTDPFQIVVPNWMFTQQLSALDMLQISNGNSFRCVTAVCVPSYYSFWNTLFHRHLLFFSLMPSCSGSVSF